MEFVIIKQEDFLKKEGNVFYISSRSPAIMNCNPDSFYVVGKTHTIKFKKQGERYLSILGSEKGLELAGNMSIIIEDG